MLFRQLIALALLPLIATVPAISSDATEADNPRKQAELEPISVLPEKGIPATWIQGVPVTHWEKDKVYVFEFWATWCGPCLAAIPHIDAIHKQITAKNINAQIVGVNVKDASSPERLKQFLAKRTVKPSYAIAVDTSRNTENLWLRPRKVIGIPHAIAIKNGNVIWAGHPTKLNADFVESMTSPDFVAGTQPKKPEKIEPSTFRVHLEKIAGLYASGKTELAEKELSRILDDKRIPSSIKQNALELPALNALAREDYRKMNACLRRKADAFPQSPENLHAVAYFILTSNDIPSDELDLALAEECLIRSTAITREIRSFISLHRKQLRMLGDIYQRRGDREAEAKAREASWLSSSECDWLNQIEKKLKDDSGNSDSLKIYTALANGEATLPREFSQPLSTEGKTKIAPASEKSETPESAQILKFFDSIEWIHGNAPKELPANGIVALNFWNTPHPGPRDFLMRRPDEWLADTGVPVIIIAIENKPGRARKVLNSPAYATDFPVGVISQERFLKDFGSKIDAQHLPTTQILRDGKAIWQGSAQDLPAWIIEEAALPDYNHSDAEARRSREKKDYRRKLNRLREIRQSASSGAPESEEQIKAFRETLKEQPTLYMRATNILAETAYARNDFAAVGKFCEEIMQTYPNVDYIAKMQLNILNSNLDLRAANLPVLILAYRNIIGSGDVYASAYWQAISQVYAEMGDWGNAVYAAFAARDATSEWKLYQTTQTHKQ